MNINITLQYILFLFHGYYIISSSLYLLYLFFRLGRKVLLYISDGGMILSLGVFGTYFYFKEHSIQDGEGELAGWIPLVALMVYVVSFSIGFGPIPWLMMGEVFPSRIRGTAASFATALNWAFTFLVTKTFMDLQVFFSIYALEFSRWDYKSIKIIVS